MFYLIMIRNNQSSIFRAEWILFKFYLHLISFSNQHSIKLLTMSIFLVFLEVNFDQSSNFSIYYHWFRENQFSDSFTSWTSPSDDEILKAIPIFQGKFYFILIDKTLVRCSCFSSSKAIVMYKNYVTEKKEMNEW